MRIVFDGTTLRPRRTGVGYYVEHLLHHLAEEGPEDELIVVSNRPIDTTRPLPARVRVAAVKWRAPGIVWMQMLAPRTLHEFGRGCRVEVNEPDEILRSLRQNRR